jgi:hypothetical protein
VNSYFKCGVADCGHIQKCRNADDFYAWDVDRGHMVSHYKWDHAPLWGVHHRPVTKGAFSDWWEFGPIPTEIAPSFVDEGQTYSWKEVMEYS